MKDDKLYLIHIVECIVRIEQYTTEGKETFLADSKTRDAVVRNLQTLAESTQRLSTELKDAHPQVEWQTIAGFRNVLVHDYLGIKWDRVWNVVEQELPGLKGKIEVILTEMGGSSK